MDQASFRPGTVAGGVRVEAEKGSGVVVGRDVWVQHLSQPSLPPPSQHLHPHRAAPHLWSGMILQAKKDFAGALHAYNASRRVAKPYDWQPTYRMWRLLTTRGQLAEAEEARAALVRLWGEEQFAWYSTDVDGDLVQYEATASAVSRVNTGPLSVG